MTTKAHSKGKYHHLPCQWEFKVKKGVRLNREINMSGQIRIGYNFASQWMWRWSEFSRAVIVGGKAELLLTLKLFR